MTRLVFAAIVFCSTLCAAPWQSPAGSPAKRESPRSAATEALLDSAPSDDDSAWRPQHDATVSLPESSWKWRTLYAGVAPTAHPAAIVANALTPPPSARASDAPSYLLHTPLLI